MGKAHGGRVLVESLRALGARHGFGVPGESYLSVLDGMHDTKGAFDFVLCRNEGGAGFMASAYGKLTGTPGLCFVTRGPGATNASIGVHTAMQDSAPMILFVGQIDTRTRDREVFQEVDYRQFFGPIAKWATEIEHIERIPEIVSRAWTTALSGRPGPVVVALPENVLNAETDVPPLSRAAAIPKPFASAEDIKAVHAALDRAERPVLLIGGGGWTSEGGAALTQFAEASDIPVVAAFRYQDIYDNSRATYAGEAGVGMLPQVRRTLENADLILAIGVRFGEMTTDNYTLFDLPDMLQTLIHVHMSAGEIGKIYQPDIAILSCPNAFATALADVPVKGPWSDWRSAARAGYEASFDLPPQPGPVDMVEVMRHLQEVLDDDAILTNGAGNFSIWNNKYFRYGTGNRLLAPQSGAMGYGLPAAIAAKVVHPKRTVVCFAGDGDFQMNCPELGTAMQAGAQPVVLILNNGSYGTIRMHQEKHFPRRVSGTELQNPDFAAMARAYGFHGERVERTEDFADAFERALASPSGAVLDLVTGIEALTPRQTLTQIRAASEP
ncbi:thiamine pyrophosphate-binding protein [Silicimonas algicola]|uniref:Acetolactate synthase-1/2/3 large subunit n=1 Tax=Silicimonas algicola TaxID=1826607 RepID=A0A316G8W2_9RHOB|nr:thiamine pyrophosphate-dependent enzyme [Silicimonas algicola]AZQ65710.1 thiamine pyrophosphate-binding protein [Silicimonas algicola]PWK56655.1 acetolactate synthase-1/2/3 large subunit [Silicimonas algicola]